MRTSRHIGRKVRAGKFLIFIGLSSQSTKTSEEKSLAGGSIIVIVVVVNAFETKRIQ